MHELVEWTERYHNELATITVSHTQQAQTTVDASYQVYVRPTIVTEGMYLLTFVEPTNQSTAPQITLKVPIDAKVSQETNRLTLSYKSSGDVTIHLRLELSNKRPNAVQKTDDTPYVREQKNSNGELRRLILHFPADTEDESLLKAGQQVLDELLKEWRFVSIAKRTAAQLTIVHQRVRVAEVSLVYLPGDSFFQLTGNDNKEEITLDISLDIFINVEKKSLSFSFDGVTYELVKNAQ